MPYTYYRIANGGPASRLKDATSSLHTAERDIERVKSILHGLVAEMGMVAHHTQDHTIKSNFVAVEKFSHHMDAIDHEVDKLIAEMDHFSKTFK